MEKESIENVLGIEYAKQLTFKTSSSMLRLSAYGQTKGSREQTGHSQS